MIVYVYFALAAILIVGGVLMYGFMQAVAAMASVVVALDPSMATDAGFIFVRSIWVWMPLILLIAVGIMIYVNSQLDAEGQQYA